MRLLNTWRRMRAIARWRRRQRDCLVLLLLFLFCVGFQACSMMCGLTAYSLQRMGLLPTSVPTPLVSPTPIVVTATPEAPSSYNPRPIPGGRAFPFSLEGDSFDWLRTGCQPPVSCE